MKKIYNIKNKHKDYSFYREMENITQTTCLPYNKIANEMTEFNCKILTTLEEFIELKKQNKIPKVRYIASCGHENEIHTNIFKSRKTGIKCPSCVSIQNGRLKKGDMNCEDGQCKFSKFEDDGVVYITSILNDNFIVHKTKEGCLADMMVKPIIVDEDKWLMIQVKTTQKPLKDYGFNCSARYKNCIVLCLCESDKRMWILDGNNITSSCKIAIGLNKSKYDKNEVTIDTIQETIINYYDKLELNTFENINTPISHLQQKEQEFRKFIELKCPFIHFIHNDRSNIVYDYKVNDYKVQEKVGSKPSEKNGAYFSLHKNDGKIGKKRQTQPYRIGDNDFYWLNFPDKKYFYIFPEEFLIKLGFIATPTQSGKKHLCIFKNTMNIKYGTEYLFDYDNLDEERIKNLFV